MQGSSYTAKKETGGKVPAGTATYKGVIKVISTVCSPGRSGGKMKAIQAVQDKHHEELI